MFEKFGEFDSVEELNRAAEAQKAEGDKEALILLAVENGIDPEDAEDFYDDCTEELATALMAAMGKLKIEAKEFKLEAVLADWVEELQAECAENEELARAVRRKGKGLDGYIAGLADKGFEERTVIDKRIVKKCSKELKNVAGNHGLAIGVPNKAERRKLMYRYYLGEDAS